MTIQEAEVEALIERMLDLLNASPLETGQHVVVLIDVLISVLGSIQCRDCRRLTRKNIEEMLPVAFDAAMKQPTTSQHVH